MNSAYRLRDKLEEKLTLKTFSTDHEKTRESTNKYFNFLIIFLIFF